MIKINVAVIFGGNSVEHEISILTGIQILQSINRQKYNVVGIYLTKDNKFMIGENFDCVETFTKGGIILEEIFLSRLGFKKRGKFSKLKPIDVVISAVHGYGTESGELAGFLEILGIPYTSVDVLGAAIGQDKIIMKKILQSSSIPVLDYVEIVKERFNEETLENEKFKDLGYPLIVKPSNLGSSIGIKYVNNQEELIKALYLAFKYDNRVIVEKALTNFKEFNCAIIEKTVSSVEEVVTNSQFLTFQDKYENTKEHILPAKISNDLENEIVNMTSLVYETLCSKGVVRIDYLYDCFTSKLYVNEINTIPGALSYYLFEDKGIYFDELIDCLIKNGLEKHYQKEKRITSFESNVLNVNKTLKK